jgi:CAAX prenyl protease-like protein
VVLLTLGLLLFSRRVIDLRCTEALASIALGVLVFAVWVAPDALWPSYRSHWLFQNPLTGSLDSTLPEAWRGSVMVLACRTLRAVILVPVIEELFWRGWLMRWLIDRDFERVPLGCYAARAFWITALLFASEHGPYWEVGLMAGVAYNWWIIRSKRLGDCILAHAVTNALLSVYVMAAGKWEYWM